MTEKEKKLFEDFEIARNNLKKYACEDAKGVHRYETLYSEAYCKLVNAGLKPKLRMKYRPSY